eukprot:3056096-Pleurochrysis_carterae.AAC.1
MFRRYRAQRSRQPQLRCGGCHRRRCAAPSRARCLHAPCLLRHGSAPQVATSTMPGVGVRVCAVAYARPLARARGRLFRSRFAPAAGRPSLLSPCSS